MTDIHIHRVTLFLRGNADDAEDGGEEDEVAVDLTGCTTAKLVLERLAASIPARDAPSAAPQPIRRRHDLGSG